MPGVVARLPPHALTGYGDAMTDPADPRLAAIAESLEGTRWAAEIWDAEWRLVWVSRETKLFLDEEDEDALGYGRHIVDVRWSEPWLSSVDDESRLGLVATELPFIANDTPGGAEQLRALVERATGQPLEPFAAEQPPPMWARRIRLTVEGQPPFPVQFVASRLTAEDGTFLGTAYAYGSTLPARLLALVTRGNEAMFERMAALVKPGRRSAAVLFADMQASGPLSRRLPSAGYFELIRSLTGEMDGAVIRNNGIVGKHAGDGVTAFFLLDDFDSPSACAAAAIQAAHEVRVTASRVADEMSERTGLFESADCAINVGLHWGGTLFIGQVVTGGRLEVTALGDEVNEGARVQQSARDGALLASKALVERLTVEDGRRIGVDPEDVVYTTVAELPGADAKAMRDAGTLPVTELYASERVPLATTG
jgi:class 3 adenylate cyclase